MANLYDKAGLVNIPVGYQDGFLYNIKPEDNTLGFRFNRDSAATRVNKEGLIEQVGYFGPELVQNGDFSQLGPELIVNGDFAADTAWDKLNATISGGKATVNVVGGAYSFVNQDKSLTSGKTYKLTAQVKGLSGSNGKDIRFRDNSANQGGLTVSNGTVTLNESLQNVELYWVANSSSVQLIIERSSVGDYSFEIDNVSVKQVDPNDYWNLGNGWSIEDGKASRTSQASSSVITANNTTLTVGKTYKCVMTISDYSSGSARFETGSTGFTLYSENGTFIEYIVATGTTFSVKGNSSFTGSVDNVSVAEVLGDKPRIDYTDSLTSPSFLLEPQSTNLITHSEDFSNSSWFDASINVLSNQIVSPEGIINADLIESTDSSSCYVSASYLSLTIGNTYTFSCFAKKGNNRWIRMGHISSGSTGCWFDLEDGVVGTVNSESATIQDYGNGWYRLTNTFVAISSGGASVAFIAPSEADDSTNAGAVGQNDYVWGAQLEALPYATSYIPTVGSTVTRAQETCVDAGNVSTFNSTEGVLYAEIAALSSSDSTNPNRNISISDGTVNNTAIFYYQSATNKISYIIIVGGSVVASGSTTSYTVTDFNKIALKWRQNDFSLYINGSEVLADTSGSTYSPGTLSKVSFDNGAGNDDFYGKTKGIYVFNEALTDDELQQLTGPEYNSFAALAAAYNYTVI